MALTPEEKVRDVLIAHTEAVGVVNEVEISQTLQAILSAIEEERGDGLPDLRPFGYAPGAYSCHCSSCAKMHVADKRARRCLECAEKAKREYTPPDTVTVPREPTEAMVEAGDAEIDKGAPTPDVWDAMINAGGA